MDRLYSLHQLYSYGFGIKQFLLKNTRCSLINFCQLLKQCYGRWMTELLFRTALAIHTVVYIKLVWYKKLLQKPPWCLKHILDTLFNDESCCWSLSSSGNRTALAVQRYLLLVRGSRFTNQRCFCLMTFYMFIFIYGTFIWYWLILESLCGA